VMDDKEPHIELYMYSLNQEFPVGGGHRVFLKTSSDWKKDISGKLVQNSQAESHVFSLEPVCINPPTTIPDGLTPADPDTPIPDFPTFPKPGPTQPIPDYGTPADWGAQWLSNEWIQNHTKAVGNGRIVRENPLTTAILREETFGSIVFEPNSDRVYKLNKPATQLFTAIQERLKVIEDENIVFDSIEFASYGPATVGKFVAALREIGLWTDM